MSVGGRRCLGWWVDEVCNFARSAKGCMEVYVRGIVDQGELADAFGDIFGEFCSVLKMGRGSCVDSGCIGGGEVFCCSNECGDVGDNVSVSSC